MNVYIDLIARQAITSPTDGTPATRPDFRAPTTYPLNLYFLRQDGSGGYAYVRFPNSIIVAGIRSAAPVEVARFTLVFRGVETSEIDTRFSTDQVRQLLEALPTVGAGNVSVTKDDRSLIVEFVGALAGTVLPTMSARIVTSTPANAELTIAVLPVTNNAVNSTQKLILRRPALAQTTVWTEVTVGTTPGWTGTLDTTAVPVSVWENPVGDISLEVTLTALPARSASDGATIGDGVGRSGADGQVITSTGASGVALISDNGSDSFLVASDSNTVYGRKFVSNDVGRVVTDSSGYISPNTTIVEVIDSGVINKARLSQRYTAKGIGLGSITDYSLDVLPSDVYYSATANFTAADVGHVIVGDNILMNTTIMAVINTQYVRLSQRPTAIGVSLAWQLIGETSNVFTSGAGLFQSGDVGAKIRAPAIFSGDATITKFISSTQVVLDKQPSGAAVGVQWTVIPVRPYPPASVSRLIAGGASAQEVQKIALAQAATGGTLTIQDGYGGSMPLAVVDNPVGTSDLEIALKQAYSNYGDLSVQEVVPGAEWNVIFGKVGGQRLLLVSEDQATYEGGVLNFVVADGPQSPTMLVENTNSAGNSAPTKWSGNGLIYIGADPNNRANINVIGQPRISRITDGTNAKMLRRRVMMFTDQYTSPNMNDTYGGYYFIGEEGGQERNGLYLTDWVYVTKPASRIEEHNQQRTILVPLYQKRATGYILDVQLVTASVSTFVDVYFDYYIEGHELAIPPDSPFAVVVHFSTVGGVEYQPKLWYKNGFDPNNGNWNIKQIQGWSRRRWMGHIWEQKRLIN